MESFHSDTIGALARTVVGQKILRFNQSLLLDLAFIDISKHRKAH